MLFLRKHRTVCLVAAAALLAAFAQAADWPGYRHDVARSGVTDEQLRMPLHLQWTYVPSHPPQPAWPEPGKMLHRMPFDYAYQVAVASGMVYFGSSADCKVYALDAATGEERWSVFTDAPVRFAPTVADGRLFVASDDGWLYCLSPFDGRVLWQFRAAPRDDMLLGNGRMISRWPLRTGTLVRDGVVYVTAGMWPTEGIYVYALRADDGTVIWKNDTSGAMYMRLPHPGAEAITGVAPQGYLLASDDVLLVPTGRSLPAGFDRATGRFLHYRPAENLRDGGAWATAFADWVFCGRHPGGPDIDVRLGEAAPARGDGLAAWECRTGNRRLDIVGKHRLVIRDGTLYASGSGSLSAYDFDAIRRGKKPGDCVKWQAPCERTYALILAGNTLFAGGRGKVTAYDASDGSVVWAHTVEDQARGLAVADGRLYVSMKNGRIACFAARQVASPRTVSPNRTVSPYDDDALASAYAELAERIIAESGATEGYCLDFGAGKGRLAYELAKRTNLNIYCIEPDARSVRAAREALDAAGLYGVRVTVHQGRLDRLPYSSYFANLIVSDTGCAGHLQKRVGAELYRALRPSGGVVYLARPPGANGPSPARLARWLREAGVPDEEMRVAEGAVRIVRGPLPGAGDWTHQYADIGKSGCASDRLVKWPMQVLWFGGPGPARMMSRHWKTAAPVSTNGRLFVAGQNSVIATDAYNGRELWTFDLPNIGIRGVQGRGSNIAADEDTVYVATGSVCFAIDAGTGEQERIYRFPTRAERYALDRPQSFAVGPAQAPLGTVTIRSAAEGLELRLVSKDRKVTNAHRTDRPQLGDSWELFFDFRPREKRGARYEPGAFQVIVVPPTVQEPRASWHPGAGVSHPRLTVSGTLSDDGSETTVRLSWQEVAGLVGGQPPDFSFGVTLNSSDDGEKIAQKTYLFTSPDSRRLTAGWATFVRDARRGEQEPEAELLPPEVERSRIWGYLGVWGDLVFGSVGTANEGEYVFALGKGDGRLRWMYRAQEAIPNNAIAVGH
ncbi:MAG: PQQ-binding-like beta-propeller repeat protein, partial [Armatimonadota bacterium]